MLFPLRRGDSPLKRPKAKNVEGHTQKTMFGMGNYYGTAAKQPLGKVRSGSTVGYRPVSKKQLGTKPRSVV